MAAARRAKAFISKVQREQPHNGMNPTANSVAFMQDLL